MEKLLLDGVSVSAVEWGLIGRRLLSVMSGSEVPTHPWVEPRTPTKPIENLLPDSDEGHYDGKDEGRERRKLKNEDSSYDSDFDPCESSTSPRGDDTHEHVSRTVSETLAAEFEDYVTLQPSHCVSRPSFPILPSGPIISRAPTSQPGIISSPPTLTVTEATPQPISAPPTFPLIAAGVSKILPTTAEGEAPAVSLATVIGSAEYPQQVEFGVKLGYSESLVQLALTKLGVNPDKNELLDELIRLGAGAPRSDCEEEAGEGEESDATGLRQIIIDGSNVAMSHGNKVKFSCKGIRLCVDWFRSRGHKEINVFVPMWRKEQSRLDAIITDQEVLQELEKEGVLSFTPSRSCGGKRIVAYDDRYIIREALMSDGVVVSNDNYRDLLNESPAFRKVIENSLLMYTWVNGRFEPPDDPLGRNGPSLDAFLRKPLLGGASSTVATKDSRPCPYGRKCTYGNKCKYMHPERGAAPVKSVTEMLQEQKQKHYQDKAKSRDSSPGENLRAKSLSLPVAASSELGVSKKPLTRTVSTFPSVSISQPAGSTKEENIFDYSNIVSSAASDSSCSSLHSPVTAQGSIDSICGSIMKGDSSLFSLCTPQLGYRQNNPWNSQETQQTNQMSTLASLPFNSHVTKHEAPPPGSSENLHPKLQRQLSINPVGDDRISKISKQLMSTPSDYANMMSISLQQQQTQQQQQQQQQAQQLFHQQLLQQNPHQQQSQQQPIQAHHRLLESDALTNRSCVGTRCISPGPPFSHSYGNREMMQSYLHPPLTRHSSSQESKQLSSYSQHMLPPCFHNPVSRNLSAPDHIRGGSQHQHQNIIPHITRLNSTSDSRLNMHGGGGGSTDQQQLMEGFDDSALARLPFQHMPLSAMNSNSPGPIGSRPMSPQHPVTGILSQSSLPSSPRVPQHLTQSSSLGLTHKLSGSSNTHEDKRLKIFYHFSQLFPEAQVRAALARNPDDTDPTKICMAILSMSGYRPVSPPQQQQVPGGGSGLALRGTASFGGSSFPSSGTLGHDAGRIDAYCTHKLSGSSNTHEDERLKIFYHLSQLFPEAQVRAALARNPDETDPTKICIAIVSIAGYRPVSPPQQQVPGGGSGLPLRGTASFGGSSFPSSGTLSHDAARIEAYCNLTKQFPEAEEQVRNILQRYPDETDFTKLCMLLMAANPQS